MTDTDTEEMTDADVIDNVEWWHANVEEEITRLQKEIVLLDEAERRIRDDGGIHVPADRADAIEWTGEMQDALESAATWEESSYQIPRDGAITALMVYCELDLPTAKRALARAEARDLWNGDALLLDGFQSRPVDLACCGIDHQFLSEYNEHTDAEHPIDELADQEVDRS